MAKRTAIVSTDQQRVDKVLALLDTVRDYLPQNYTASALPNGDILIEGEDDHGWTLDGYVIPRLGSGLIWAVECAPCPGVECDRTVTQIDSWGVKRVVGGSRGVTHPPGCECKGTGVLSLSAMRCNRCHRPMEGTTAYDGACECGGLIEATPA